ncbi:MAG: GtrA family protein [Acidobacteria bacterium]|nr:GtrA family protein [Acidobacteriota bacterium]
MKQVVSAVLKKKTDSMSIQFFRYGLVGGIAYLVDFGLLFVFTEYAGISYLFSAALSFLAGLTVNYLLSILWVFKTRSVENRMAEFSVFTFIGLAGLGLNELLLWIFTGLMGWYYLLSKLAATPLVFLWNFFARRIVLFSPPRRSRNSEGESVE